MMTSVKKPLKIRMKPITGWYKNTIQKGLKNSVRKWEKYKREHLKMEKENTMKNR
jgi:hypothetical protein